MLGSITRGIQIAEKIKRKKNQLNLRWEDFPGWPRVITKVEEEVGESSVTGVQCETDSIRHCQGHEPRKAGSSYRLAETRIRDPQEP